MIYHFHSFIPYKKRPLFEMTIKDNFNELFMCKLTHLKAVVSKCKNSSLHSNQNSLARENGRHLVTSQLVSREMTSEKRAQKFHTDDVSLPRCG